MCYPKVGRIFSLSSITNHYNSVLNTLEEKRSKLVNILKEKDMTEMKENEKNKQLSAVNDLGKTWEELYLTRQQLGKILNHAVTSINNNEKSEESDTKESIDVNKNEVEENLNKVLKSIERQGNVWMININTLDNKLQQFELKVNQLKIAFRRLAFDSVAFKFDTGIELYEGKLIINVILNQKQHNEMKELNYPRHIHGKVSCIEKQIIPSTNVGKFKRNDSVFVVHLESITSVNL